MPYKREYQDVFTIEEEFLLIVTKRGQHVHTFFAKNSEDLEEVKFDARKLARDLNAEVTQFNCQTLEREIL